MYKGLEGDIVERVKKMVGITGEISPFKLYDMLYIRWKNLQIVKNTDTEIRKITEQRLAEINQLLDQLIGYIREGHLKAPHHHRHCH